MKLTKSLLLKLIREEMEAEMGGHSDEPFVELLNVLINDADGAPTNVSSFDAEGLKRDVEKLYQVSGDRVSLTELGKKVVAALYPEDSKDFLEPSEMERNLMKRAKGEPYQPSMFESRKRKLQEEKKSGEELEKSVKSSSVSRLKKAQQNFF